MLKEKNWKESAVGTKYTGVVGKCYGKRRVGKNSGWSDEGLERYDSLARLASDFRNRKVFKQWEARFLREMKEEALEDDKKAKAVSKPLTKRPKVFHELWPIQNSTARPLKDQQKAPVQTKHAHDEVEAFEETFNSLGVDENPIVGQTAAI